MQLSLGPKPQLDEKKIDDLLKLDTGGPLHSSCTFQTCIVTVSQIN